MAKKMLSNNGSIICTTSDKISISQDGGIEIKFSGKPIDVRITEAGFIYLIIDISFSMAGFKLQQAKSGALDFAKDALKKDYFTGLISFGSEAVLVHEPSKDIQVIAQKLASLEVRGSTNMTSAIILATERLRGKTGFKVMVIVTDGKPDELHSALEASQRAKSLSIDIITIGTDDADASFLKQIASRTDLNVMVKSDNLAQGIISTLGMLPQHKKSGES